MAKEYSNLDDFLLLDAQGLADAVLHCPECGKDHKIPIGKMKVGPGLAGEIPELAARILGRPPGKTALIYDRAIEELVVKTFGPVKKALNLEYLPLGHSGFWLDPNDELGDETAGKIDAMKADIVIGAGSGVIADLTKWAATKAFVPFILYGTAASMNAHASITATITRGGVKTSEWLDPAAAVLMDTAIIQKAPKPMGLAGLGDLVARSICNADWLLAHIVRGKDFCPVPYLLTALGEGRYLGAAEGLNEGAPAAAEILAEASLVSAVSMTMMAGETSPSSGAEHVFSHFWDLQAEMGLATKNLHGIQVGIGTVLSFTLWEHMRDLDISAIDIPSVCRARPSLEAIRWENDDLFGDKAVLFNKAVEEKWIDDEFLPEYLASILDGWPTMWRSLLPYVGDAAQVRSALEKAGYKMSLSMIGRTRKQVLDAMVYGSRYRSRYTILDLALDLGVLPNAAEEILDKAGL
ncbi:MAG: iron-containing alcohol dehydrogenase [Spirochaetales bacterium]|nr:iron-containing alcohol dehydrogenase [Spirochaetales bacterium]